MASPLQQFEIKTLLPLPSVAGVDVSLTNSALMMIIALGLAVLSLMAAVRTGQLVPSKGQAAAEMYYKFLRNLVTDMAGPKAMPFVPLIFSLFTFILLGNVLGMFPYSFTFTSHIIVTLALALIVFFAVLITGLVKHGLHFFHLFLPEGVPLALAPLIIIIEFFSFLVRPFSLGMRLFANMLAGHVLIKVLLGLAVMFGAIGVLPFLFSVVFVGFELFVALLQAYIFTILTCVYLNDAINLH